MRVLPLAGLSAVALTAALAAPAQARQAAADPLVDAVIVQARDKVGLLEKQPNDTVFGLDKALIDTPRSASFVSDLTLARYGVETVDDLTAVSPGTFTASFYGVAGAVNIRGTLAETYFRGFKRVENRGTYSTPIGDAARIEIVRGPPAPVHGAGKVGGMLNLIPKSARDEGRRLAGPEGEASLTVGAYAKKVASAQLSAPLRLGRFEGGLHAYVEAEDSHSYYRGVYPERRTGQLSVDLDLGDGWSTAFGAMVYGSDGDVQTPGWNRLTQELIDHQTYVTGRDASLVDADGDGRLTPGEIGPYPFGSALYLAYFGAPVSDAVHRLDVGVGTTRLDPRTVYVSGADFSETRTHTAYLDLDKALDGGASLSLQLFYDDQDNRRFTSYGYPAATDASVWEARLSHVRADTAWGGAVAVRSRIGASYRRYAGRRRESYNSGLIALDRRDLAFGATATDLIDGPFTVEPGGIGLPWETDNRGRWRQAGLFVTSDIGLGPRLSLLLGGRYDDYAVEAHDTGALPFTVAGRQSAGDDKLTYSASLTYRGAAGLTPYLTYAKASALEMSQAGDVAPGLVADGGWLSESDLAEAGVKFQLLRGTLVGALAGYRQNRTQLLSGPPVSVQGTRAKGVELEVRWLVSERFSLTFAGNSQRTTIKGPDTSFQYIPAHTAGVAGPDGFGGAYVVWAFNSLPGRAGDYAYTLIPRTVASLYGTYTSAGHAWGRTGGALGATWVGATAGTVENAVRYPAYAVVKASAYYQAGPYTVTLNLDNLLDALYFTPDADTYANLGALPGKGREWRMTLRRRF